MTRFSLSAANFYDWQRESRSFEGMAMYRFRRFALADGGTAVLVVTSDLSEALRVADRLLVVRNGTVTREFGRDARQADVLAAAAGADDGEATGDREEVTA